MSNNSIAVLGVRKRGENNVVKKRCPIRGVGLFSIRLLNHCDDDDDGAERTGCRTREEKEATSNVPLFCERTDACVCVSVSSQSLGCRGIEWGWIGSCK
jgi:hypothetical protein